MGNSESPDPGDPRRRYRPHPWWSRVLYLLYGLFVATGAWYAWRDGQTGTAIAVAGIAAVLIWKAAQRAR